MERLSKENGIKTVTSISEHTLFKSRWRVGKCNRCTVWLRHNFIKTPINLSLRRVENGSGGVSSAIWKLQSWNSRHKEGHKTKPRTCSTHVTYPDWKCNTADVFGLCLGGWHCSRSRDWTGWNEFLGGIFIKRCILADFEECEWILQYLVRVIFVFWWE